jgi:hypothetical protein
MSKRLEEILEKKQKQREESRIDHEETRRAWISDCSNLMSRITNWLTPLLDKGLVEIYSEKIPIFEDQLGEYEVEELRIVFLKSEILKVRPIARFIIGAKGRVDIVAGGTSLVMLFPSEPGKWMFTRRDGRPGKFKTWPFNKDTFDEFLSQFLEE